MNRVAAVIVALTVATVTAVAQSPAPPSVDERVNALLERMTLDEKVGQLNQYSHTFDVTGPAPTDQDGNRRYRMIRGGRVGSMLNVTGARATCEAQRLAVESSRLKIPLLFGFDVIHGYRTVFPIPLAEAASWDLEAIERSARIAATEAAAAGLHWTFAPMVDIARDARWGRVMEGAGEDPFLGAAVAAARVRGFQGDDLRATDTLAACAKHLAGYGFVEAGREYNTVELTEHTLRNVVLPPFKAAVDAGVATVMNSFSEIGGIPATASVHLQREILKGEWGFEGFVVSDWDSIGELTFHGVAVDEREASALAITAGSDMDMESSAYVEHLAALVEDGVVDESLVDEAVRRVLRVKYQLGLFEDPYRYCDEGREQATLLAPSHLAAARDMARRSIVLLKNDGPVLPLAKTGGAIAVIGSLAADKDSPLGSWRGTAIPDSAVSLLEGVKAAVGADVRVTYAEGAPLGVGERSFVRELELNHDDRSGFPAAVAAARDADVVIVAVGEEAFQSGEARSVVDLRLKGVQEDLLRAVREANENVVVVVMSGRPLALTWMAANVPAILQCWHLGSEAGHAVADVLFGDFNPSGKLPISFPRHVGQAPVYYNHKMTGRPESEGNVFWSHYSDESNEPLYPFGFGLSYTTFESSPPELSNAAITMGGELTVSVTVKNTGRRAGAEVVQLYVRDLVGSVTRPVRELKGFERVELGPGASARVVFTLTSDDLAFYSRRGRWEAEPGDFVVFVGSSSKDLAGAGFSLLATGAS